MQPAQVAVDGDIVVVEDDEDVGFSCAGIVQAFEGQASGQRAVPDERHHLFLPAVDAGGFGEP